MVCNKLPNTATKEERLKAHKVKMRAKEILQNRMHEQMAGSTYTAANLSRNHPDYELTTAEHLEKKAKRSIEKSS